MSTDNSFFELNLISDPPEGQQSQGVRDVNQNGCHQNDTVDKVIQVYDIIMASQIE